MTGTIPTELALLPYLQSLTLSSNLFTGSLPVEYGEMKHLLQLDIHTNQFTGTIPRSYYDSPSMTELNIGGNAISGSLPADQITGLSEFNKFVVFDNLLEGTIPTEFGQLSVMSKCIRFPSLSRNRCSRHFTNLLFPWAVSYRILYFTTEFLHWDLANRGWQSSQYN
jgi:Leucine-rich repeat (LRR) protein